MTVGLLNRRQLLVTGAAVLAGGTLARAHNGTVHVTIEKLAFPSRFGGDPKGAFDLVIPSLPGFGFSSKPVRPIGQRTTARLFNTLMTKVLGYDRYLAQGGDWGAMITSWLGHEHHNHVRAIHLNMMALRPFGGPKDEAEVAWLTRQGQMMELMGAYFRLQASKPQSLADLLALDESARAVAEAAVRRQTP